MTFHGDSSGDFFGISVSGAGDVTGDGVPDFIVGASRDDNNGFDSGSARVISGADGTEVYTVDGDSSRDQFGWSVSGLGDVTGDGIDDFAVGARNGGLNNGGYVRVFVSVPTPCPADLDPPGGDGELGFFDLVAYLTLFAAMDPAADLDPAGGDGAFGFFDLVAYLTLFAAGCP